MPVEPAHFAANADYTRIMSNDSGGEHNRKDSCGAPSLESSSLLNGHPWDTGSFRYFLITPLNEKQ